MGGGRDVLVDDLLAGGPGDLGGVVRERPGHVPAQLVGPAEVALAGQDGHGRSRVVGAGGGGDPALARVGHDGPVGQHGGQVRGVVLRVPAVAQEGVRQAGVEDQLLGHLVLGRQLDVRVGAAQDAGVRELRHARRLRRVDDRGVLGDAAADLAAGDEQHPVTGPEGPGQRLGVVVVGDPKLDAAGGEAGGLVLVADDGGDAVGGDGGQQLLHDEAAELSGGSGDDDAHGVFLLFRCSCFCSCVLVLTLGVALTKGKYPL